MIWLSYIGLALNLAGVVLSVVQYLRFRRIMRHALALDLLLTRLCVNAYTNQLMPIWKPWLQSMGDVTVEVTGKRRSP